MTAAAPTTPVEAVPAAASPVRVLVVDDSAVIRGLMTRALEADPLVRVVGTAMHGEAALSWLDRNASAAGPAADVVVSDVEMPVLDGLATLDRVQRRYPGLPVVMASSLTYEGAATTVQALARGAAGCVAKPSGANASAAVEALSAELVALVKAVARRPRTAEPRRATVPPPAARRPAAAHADPQVLVVGASTGGPKALTEVLAGLGRGFRLPILLVQHMPPLFTPLLARHLEKDCGRPAGEAADGEPILPGRTYVAPGGFHLAVERRDGRAVAVLTQEPPEHFCRPSVNPLFRSAARVYGPAALAVMLTGMGEDGLEGAHEVVAAGGRLLAQDEATSVVWGMPGAVARAGLAEQVLPLDAIAPAVRRLCRTEPR